MNLGIEYLGSHMWILSFKTARVQPNEQRLKSICDLKLVVFMMPLYICMFKTALRMFLSCISCSMMASFGVSGAHRGYWVLNSLPMVLVLKAIAPLSGSTWLPNVYNLGYFEC